jgi:hypothetical protein
MKLKGAERATKRPWRVWSEEGLDKAGRQLVSVCFAPDDDSKHVCIADVAHKDRAAAFANAHLIVNAVNAANDVAELCEMADFSPTRGVISTGGVHYALVPILTVDGMRKLARRIHKRLKGVEHGE